MMLFLRPPLKLALLQIAGKAERLRLPVEEPLDEIRRFHEVPVS